MSEELEIPVSEGAKSTEENVLAIYIYCPELLGSLTPLFTTDLKHSA